MLKFIILVQNGDHHGTIFDVQSLFLKILKETIELLQKVNERVCSVEAKPEELSSIQETLDKLSAAILAKENLSRTETDQEHRYSNLDLSLSITSMLANIAFINLLGPHGFSTNNSLAQQPQSGMGSLHQVSH